MPIKSRGLRTVSGVTQPALLRHAKNQSTVFAVAFAVAVAVVGRISGVPITHVR